MPKNNSGAVLGAILVTIAVFVLTDLSKFFASGLPWPTDFNGWLQLIIPSLVAGALASLTPHYSNSERSTGFRVINSSRDAPVIDANTSPILVQRNDQPAIVLTPTTVVSPATSNPTSPGVPPESQDPNTEVHNRG